jgi:hypothetical protein
MVSVLARSIYTSVSPWEATLKEIEQAHSDEQLERAPDGADKVETAYLRH